MNKALRKKSSLAKLGDKNPNWKGDKVKYHGVHNWINRNYKKPKLCQNCKKNPAYDLANISQKYKRDIKDWEWLCRRCHMIKDGRLDRLIARSKSNTTAIKKHCMICNKISLIIPARIKIGGGKYCSHHCAMIARYKK